MCDSQRNNNVTDSVEQNKPKNGSNVEIDSDTSIIDESIIDESIIDESMIDPCTKTPIGFYSYLFPTYSQIKANEQIDSSLDKKIESDSLLDQTKIDNYEKYFEEEYRKIKIQELDAHLKLSKSIRKFKDMYINESAFRIENNNDINYDNSISLQKNINNIVSFSKNDFLNIIFETYPKDEDIITQFLKDFHREIISINGQIFDDVNLLFLELSKYNRIIEIDKRSSSIFILSLLLMCQSSFYVSFLHIHQKLIKMKQDIVQKCDLTDKISNKISIDADPKMNYHLTDGKKKDKIELTIDCQNICSVFRAEYKINDIINEEIVTNIYSETIFNTAANNCLILYETSDDK